MSDYCSQGASGLLTVEQASTAIHASLSPITGHEQVILKQAIGRILAETVFASINLPHFRNAAMDGYAVNSRDLDTVAAKSLKLTGTAWAGRPFQAMLNAGECVRIFTGAPVPDGADRVIMQEQVQKNADEILFPGNLQTAKNIREIGEDIRKGATLLNARKKLTAFDISLLAAAGIHSVTVKRKLNIAFFSTGDELTSVGEQLEPGEIYDSNRYTLSGLLNEPLYDAVDLGVIRDNKEQLRTTLCECAEIYDVIISTGGASVGDADFIQEILAEIGTVNFWKIAMKPGKPLAYGKIGQCLFFGLPGNPVSVIATLQQLVRPALLQLAGGGLVKTLRLRARAGSSLSKTAGRQEFQRGILEQDNHGELVVESAGNQGSHILSTISRANCFIILPATCAGVQAGEWVEIEPFNFQN